jgi:hypothetical protein
MGGKFARVTDAISLHMGAAGDDEANVLCASPVIGFFIIRRRAIVVAGPRSHRGHRNAIAQDNVWRECDLLE